MRFSDSRNQRILKLTSVWADKLYLLLKNVFQLIKKKIKCFLMSYLCQILNLKVLQIVQHFFLVWINYNNIDNCSKRKSQHAIFNWYKDAFVKHNLMKQIFASLPIISVHIVCTVYIKQHCTWSFLFCSLFKLDIHFSSCFSN